MIIQQVPIKMSKIYLHADKSSDDKYNATEILKGGLENHLWGFEYGDVAEGEFQIWEYPSGNIFQVTSDRVVLEKDYYGSPDKDVWLPILKPIGSDLEKVRDAYEYLSSLPPNKGIIDTIKSLFKK